MTETDKPEMKRVVREKDLRARRAGTWSLVMGMCAVLLEGERLIQNNTDIWNNVALVGAVLAIFYGFILARNGPTEGMGSAGGTLGSIILIEVFLWPSAAQIIRDIDGNLPEAISFGAIVMALLILTSLFFVLIRGDVQRIEKV